MFLHILALQLAFHVLICFSPFDLLVGECLVLPSFFWYIDLCFSIFSEGELFSPILLVCNIAFAFLSGTECIMHITIICFQSTVVTFQFYFG